MARPLKMGVDYFPLDTTLDLKFELLEAEYGLKAFAIVVKLYQMIYGQQGYYCEWNEDVGLLFSRKCNEGCNLVSEIVGAAIKRGIFDEDLYSKYGILTSRGIQSRYIEMKKGDISKIENDYLLLNAPQKKVFAEKNPVSEEKTSVYGEKTPQSKVKESKVNKNKGNKINDICADKQHRTRFVKPTVEEIALYCRERNNGIDAEHFFDYYESKGWTVGKQPMKDWKAAVRNWERNGYSGSGKKTEQVVKGNYEQRDYDDELLDGFVNAGLN